MRVLVTGCAGFIGFHLSKRLLEEGHDVFGVDSINDYYDPKLKMGRLNILLRHGLKFKKIDIRDMRSLYGAEIVINMAAQAGVRRSLESPQEYIDNNISGFLNILNLCRDSDVKNLFYASSSSVYGGNSKQPFSESDITESPLNIYAVTKKANELMAEAYSSLYGIKSVGLRFFTVYGPWGRPDMALYKFTESMKKGRAIDLYNYGNHMRSFTYVDDVVESIIRLIGNTHETDIYNIGGGSSRSLMDCVGIISKCLGVRANINELPLQKGDAESTVADTSKIFKKTGYKPATDLEEGISKFIQWHGSELEGL